MHVFGAVSKPAPDWNGTAVVDREFKEIKLSDFRGKWCVRVNIKMTYVHSTMLNSAVVSSRKVLGVLFLPFGLVSCDPRDTSFYSLYATICQPVGAD